jgi:hypothetical protein
MAQIQQAGGDPNMSIAQARVIVHNAYVGSQIKPPKPPAKTGSQRALQAELTDAGGLDVAGGAAVGIDGPSRAEIESEISRQDTDVTSEGKSQAQYLGGSRSIDYLEKIFWPFANYPNIDDYYFDIYESHYSEELYASAYACLDSGLCENPFNIETIENSGDRGIILASTLVNAANPGYSFFLEEIGADPTNLQNYDPWWLHSLMRIHPREVMIAKDKFDSYMENKFGWNIDDYEDWVQQDLDGNTSGWGNPAE